MCTIVTDVKFASVISFSRFSASMFPPHIRPVRRKERCLLFCLVLRCLVAYCRSTLFALVYSIENCYKMHAIWTDWIACRRERVKETFGGDFSNHCISLMLVISCNLNEQRLKGQVKIEYFNINAATMTMTTNHSKCK